MARNLPSLNSHAPCPPTCVVQPGMCKNKTSSDIMLPAWHGCHCVAGLLIKETNWLAISSTFVSQPVSSPSSRLRMSVLCHYRRLNCHDEINSHLTTFPKHLYSSHLLHFQGGLHSGITASLYVDQQVLTDGLTTDDHKKSHPCSTNSTEEWKINGMKTAYLWRWLWD